MHFDHPFISEPKICNFFSYENLFVIESNFNLEKYNRSLFTQFGIDFPNQLFSSVKKRQAEFLAGRVVAKHGLRKFGKAHIPVTIGEKRAPIWPDGIMGSISHSGEKALCAITNKTDFKFLGVDHEEIISNDIYEISEQILCSGELQRLESSDLLFNEAITLAFSAKESLFKALFPIVKDYFNFSAARIESIDLKTKTFKIALVETLNRKLGAGKILNGKYHLNPSNVTTLIVE